MPYIGKEPARVPVTAADIPDDSITAAKIVDGAITIADIADDAVTEDKLANAINTAIAANTAKTTNATHTGEVTGSGALTITADAVTGAKIADDAVESEHIAAGAVDDAHIVGLTSSKLSGNLPALNASSLTNIPAANITGTLPAIDGSALTGVATDLTSIRNDIATLALHSAVADNKAAYNLPSSFIDQFEDDTGLATQTDIDRDTSSEFISSVTPASGIDSYAKCVLHMEDTGLTDAIGTHTTTLGGSVARSSSQAKFGTYSAVFTTGAFISMADHADWDLGTGDYTIDMWIYQLAATAGSWPAFAQSVGGNPNSNNSWFFSTNNSATGAWVGTHPDSGTVAEIGWTATYGVTVEDEWFHLAVVKTGTSIKTFINGTIATGNGTYTNAAFDDFNGSSRLMMIGAMSNEGNADFKGYIDEVRFSKGIARWTSNFTPQATAYGAAVVSATGTLISTAQTANAAQTKVSGVILYKNNEGTATLGTDLKIYFTCNGGTNWTESTPAAAGTFSTGILMAKCPEVTCTSGTDVRYKVVWANQASGSKETQLHGIAMNY